MAWRGAVRIGFFLRADKVIESSELLPLVAQAV
jgi:hypothetical protein